MPKSYRSRDLKLVLDCAEELLPTLILKKVVDVPISFDTNFYEITSAIRALVKTNHPEIDFNDILVNSKERRISIIS